MLLIIILFLFIIPSTSFATSSQLFYQETSRIDPNKIISVDFSNSNYTGLSEFAPPQWRIDYTLNPLSELKITSKNAGIKMIIGENLAFHGSIDYSSFSGQRNVKEIVAGFVYSMELGKLKININPYFEGETLRFSQYNLGAVYPATPELELIGEFLFNHSSGENFYQAVVLGARYQPTDNLIIDLGLYTHLYRVGNSVPTSYSSSSLPAVMKVSFNY